MFLKGVYTLIMKAELSKREVLSKCSVCVGFNIRKASRAISQYYESVLKPSGIRGTQFSLLANIRSAGKPTINELGGEANILQLYPNVICAKLNIELPLTVH